MSQRAGARYHDLREAHAPRASAHPHGRRHGAPADYTLVHAGRQVRVGPVAFWIAVGTLVIMGGWSVATATYFGFRDDVLTRLIARQAHMQFAYEDRIADLRTQVDRITSRQLLDQDQFEQRLAEMMRRQAALEQRTSALAAVADPTVTGSIKRRHGATPAPAVLKAMPKPSPINGIAIFAAPPEREARLPSAGDRPPATTAANGGVLGTLERLQSSLQRVERSQADALNELEHKFDGKARRIRTVLADLGLNPSKVSARGTGGPFVPVKPHANAGPFERQLYRISLARAQFNRLSHALITVPVRKPIDGEVDISSGFGVRIDPFLAKPAMHTGLDFRGDIGDRVRATAAGIVKTAGWSGGYGKMVEIDHGNGFATRYGHLSQINVWPGDKVKPGEIIGRLGSTGRSTGPHLHYETRVDGEPVDPQKFLRAGVRLGSAL
jgi:murein DD-endopeptidase MepM/ murein hydrolase activator NlpD